MLEQHYKATSTSRDEVTHRDISLFRVHWYERCIVINIDMTAGIGRLLHVHKLIVTDRNHVSTNCTFGLKAVVQIYVEHSVFI